MVKLSDVAREARVSEATVSRALNDHSTVNAELAARVREVALRLDYRPNAVARSLRRQKADVIALIISDVSNPFFTAVARGVEDVAQARGYSVLLCNSDEDSDKEARYIRVAETERVAGVVLSPHDASTDVARLVGAGIPLTIVDRPLDVLFDRVMVPSAEGAMQATRHLVEAGWSRPACITGPEGAATAADRLDGYRRALAEAGGHDDLHAHAPFTVEGGESAAATLLDASPAPDSLFIANSSMALGAIGELRRRGLVIGRDVGMIMFDDAPWAPYIDPPISVIAQPAYEVGTAAATLLMQRIDGTETGEPKSSVLETRLIPRASSQRAR